ncbi:hypothetical protein [Muricoccus radiodurans]|uniref:hypothetical protein n=1 Tax=Muricoccus radiodurans TaxID=2231721 RepID=UPI003CEDE45B
MSAASASSLTVRVPLAIRRRPGRKMVVTPAVATGPVVPSAQTHADPALLEALARAFRYQKLLDEGRYASITEMAVGERIERGYLGTLLRLTLLAPEMVEAILVGQRPATVDLPRLMGPFPTAWDGQRLAFATAPSHPSQSRRAA